MPPYEMVEPDAAGRNDGNAGTDRRWMQRALQQAERGVGLASPNPTVGCVVVQGGRAAGKGFHQYDARDHAEVVALAQAGSLARGATAYVTLEPCCHQGRTGPCADALLAAGIGRVVVATLDPNPLVRGQGVARLRAAGVEVTIGVHQQAARRLNDSFARFIVSGLPFVTMKVASSLDGRIAPASRENGTPHWLTGAAARAEVHRVRHAADGILVGVGTVLADDPWLTDRSERRRRRRLLRIVLDSRLRTPLDSNLVRTAQEDVLLCFQEAGEERQQAFTARGIQLVQVAPAAQGKGLDLGEVLRHLASLQIGSLLLEGGATLHTTALKGQWVDRMILFYAPKMLGDSAVPMLGSLPELPPLNNYELKRFGDDFAVEACLRDPWAPVP